MPSNHTAVPKPGDPDTLICKGICPGTKKQWTLEVPREGYEDWKYNRTLIQLALPSLSPDERELLISGYSPEGWRQLFGDMEDDDA